MTAHPLYRPCLLQRALACCAISLVCSPVAAQQAEFQELSEQIRQKVQSAFALDPADLKDDAALLATRSLVARSIAETMNRSNMTIDFKVPESKTFVPPPQELRTEKKADAEIECSPDQWCNYGCDSPWPWEKAGCELDKWACKSGQKLDCERRKSMAQAISNKKVATVSFRDVSVKGSAKATRVSLDVSPALDAVTLRAALSASIRMSVSGHLAPEPLITVIAACIPHDFRFTDETIDLNESHLTLTSTLNIVADNDTVSVSVEPSKPKVTLHFAGTPALRFISRNPGAFLACSVPYAIAGIADITHPNDMAKLELELPAPPQSQTLGKLTTKTDGWEIQAVPRATAKALGLTGHVTATSKTSLAPPEH